MKATVKTVLAATATLLESPTNRFGKLEFYSAEAMAAREQIRLWAIEYGVAPSQSVLEQAAKVARAVLASSS
jgi:hypothetical protein